MTEQTERDDELVERVQDAIGEYLESMDDQEGYENTQAIIALVRADERARIREQLLQIARRYEWQTGNREVEYITSLLDTIGLTEEEPK